MEIEFRFNEKYQPGGNRPIGHVTLTEATGDLWKAPVWVNRGNENDRTIGHFERRRVVGKSVVTTKGEKRIPLSDERLSKYATEVEDACAQER